MSSNLYPLVYKPGIRRDGTTFQGDYCTDGQWIRFQRGNIRKMGGMKGLSYNPSWDLRRVSGITMTPDINNSANIVIYLPSADASIRRLVITQDFSFQADSGNVYVTVHPVPDFLWKSELAIQGNNQQIVYLGAPSFTNINNSDEAILLFGNLYGVNLQLQPSNNPPPLNGINGILFVNPYLFIFGSNGFVGWSNRTNIQDFSGILNNTINISNDKVIDIRSIRGGINTPTLLCWTLSSVVRLINTSSDPETFSFQRDVLSKTSSILSSRSVVEYDGLFFWPGTNRFFQYNGIVQELTNTMNLNYFFENIDMDNRQLVHGVKNTQYGEIWWFYPEKGQAINGINTRAIIYNVRENSWYDTAINRDAAYYSEDFGFMATYGASLTAPITPLALYRHEYETFITPTLRNIGINELIPSPNQQNITVAIDSNVTTPTISWAAFNPMKQLTGVDRWMYLITIEPDFILMPADTDMNVTINTKQYAQDFPISVGPFPINTPNTGPNDDPLDAKVDTATQGRLITLTFASSTNFEMGHIMLLIGIGDGQ